MTMKFKNQAAQGDVMFTRVDELPDGLKKVLPENGQYVVAHSETGHHHVIKEAPGVGLYANDNDPFTAWLVVDNSATIEHMRSFHTHEAIEFAPGVYEIKRQREWGLEGWRRAAD